MSADPDSWEESETNDHVPPNPEFDRMVRDNEVRTYLYDTLQDEFQLEPGEANDAVSGYLADRGEPLPDYLDPIDLSGVAPDSYAWWAAQADPATLAVRENAQRVATIQAEPVAAQVKAASTAALIEPGSTLYNTAYLDGAAAALAELVADHHPDLVTGFDSRLPRPVQPGEAAADMEAAEAAIGLLREDRDRRGYTDQDAATARALRGVLDAAEAWNTVAAAEPVQPAPLEDELRPDRVQSRDWDGDVVVDAGFAGVTITVQRTAGVGGAVNYDFLASGPGGRGPLRDVSTTEMGMIAAGDRSPNPARAVVYDEVGAQVQHHLSGLADAVAQQQSARQQQENRRAAAVQPTVSTAARTTRERSL